MAYLVPTISYIQALPIQQLAVVTSTGGTITGPAGFGSSLFLSRMFLPGQMALTEAQAALGMSFNASSNGAGTISRSLVIYSFGNSTSLASLFSTSGTSAWASGTTTSGASTSLTQFQGGWAGTLIQPMTFASVSIQPGDYVVGQLFNFAQAVGASSWSLSLYGEGPATISSASAGAQTSAGLAAASGITGALGTTTLSVLSTGGLIAASGLTGLSSIGTNVAGATNWYVSHAQSAVASLSTLVFSTGTITIAQASQVVSVGTQAGSILSASTPVGAVTSVSLGVSAGSIQTASTAVSAVTALGPGAFVQFAYVGTGAATAGLPSKFSMGIMSTGAIPASLAMSAVGLSVSGTGVQVQPWFALCGA